MTGFIKSLLLKLFGQEKYLALTSGLFFFAFKKGWLQNNPSYFTHYLVSQFIKPGDTVIDIGANLGYYSVLFAEKSGPQGNVIAVEPIKVYRKVLADNVKPYKQVSILPFALGEKEGLLKMGNPSNEKYRHGLMRVLKENEVGTEYYEVPVKNPLELFAALEKADYIKCDIEGYEVPVIPAMKPFIEKHRPVLQVETDGENKKVLMGLFTSLNYATYFAGRHHLISYPDNNLPLPGDLIAIPFEKLSFFKEWME